MKIYFFHATYSFTYLPCKFLVFAGNSKNIVMLHRVHQFANGMLVYFSIIHLAFLCVFVHRVWKTLFTSFSAHRQRRLVRLINLWGDIINTTAAAAAPIPKCTHECYAFQMKEKHTLFVLSAYVFLCAKIIALKNERKKKSQMDCVFSVPILRFSPLVCTQLSVLYSLNIVKVL